MEYLTPAQVAAELAELGVKTAAVREWCEKGQIRAKRLPSGRWKIPRAEVDRIKQES